MTAISFTMALPNSVIERHRVLWTEYPMSRLIEGYRFEGADFLFGARAGILCV